VRVLGVDAGRAGAVALIDTETGEVRIEDTQLECDRTLNCHWFLERLVEWEPEYAVIENVFKPNSLVEMKGEFQAVCKLAGVPLTHVAVVTWKKKVLGDNTSDKQRSIACTQRLYPQADLNRLSPKKKLPSVNDDRAEAVLLAHYLLTTLNP
jgi:hypothetical protein